MSNTTGKKIFYDGKPVQVDSAIRDSTGLVINTTYAKKTEVGGVQLLNQPVHFDLQSTPDYADYPYRGEVTDSTITSNTYATVTFSSEQATSGNYSSICNTDTGVLYIYANTNLTPGANDTVTIPTINLGGGQTTTSTIDSAPTSGSGNAVSSGGVFTNCVRTSGNQTITGEKIFKNRIVLIADSTDPYIQILSNYPRLIGQNGNNLTSADGMLFQLYGFDSSNAYYQEDIYRRGTTGYTEVHHYVKNKNGNFVDFSIYYGDDGVGYMRGPYRAYNSANTTDIMTIGSFMQGYSDRASGVVYDATETGVQNWLHVDLNNKDAVINRTVKLSSSYVYYPQETGDNVYCTDGVRYVDWVLSGFVGVHVYGWGQDSAFHHWVNGYNSNTGMWAGWRRTDNHSGPITETNPASEFYVQRCGKLVFVNMIGYYATSTGVRTVLTDLPTAVAQFTSHANDGNGYYNGELWITSGGTSVNYRPIIANSACYATLIYLTNS